MNTLKAVFATAGTDEALCCWCGSPDKNYVTVDNGVLVTIGFDGREQMFAAHRTCIIGSIVDKAQTGPLFEPRPMQT